MECPICKQELDFWQTKVKKVSNSYLIQTVRGRCFTCEKLWEGKRGIQIFSVTMINEVKENENGND